jgi:hypothetical protein
LLGWRWLELEFEAHRDAEAVAGPPLERYAHDAYNEVQAPQWAVFLPGCAGAMAVAGEPLNMGTGFFLRGSVKGNANDLVRRDKWGRTADDGAPKLPASVIEGTTEEHIESWAPFKTGQK